MTVNILKRWLIGFLVLGWWSSNLCAEEDTTTQSITIRAQHFTQHDVGQGAEGGWEMSEPGRISCTLESPERGSYTFVLMARGQKEGEQWPMLAAGINDEVALEQTVRTRNWGSYTFTRELEKGDSTLFVDLLDGDRKENPLLRIAHVTVISPAEVPAVARITKEEVVKPQPLEAGAGEKVTKKEPLARGTLAVAVIDDTGVAVKGAAVEVMHEDEGVLGKGRTDEEGLFSCDVYAGTLRISAKSRRSGQAEDTMEMKAEEGGAASMVLLLTSDADEVVGR